MEAFKERLKAANVQEASWYIEMAKMLEGDPKLLTYIRSSWSQTVLHLPFPLRERFVNLSACEIQSTCPVLDPVLLCVFLRSISDDSNWEACVLENNLEFEKKQLEHFRRIESTTALYLPKHLKGVTVLRDKGNGKFQVGHGDHGELKANFAGVSFRLSKNMNDKTPRIGGLVEWGTSIVGEDEGDWVKIKVEPFNSEAQGKCNKGKGQGKGKQLFPSTEHIEGIICWLSRILHVVPVDQTLWAEFSEAAAKVDELVAQQRTKYTIDLIRDEFHVLYIGHSYWHIERDGRRPHLEDYLQRSEWFTVDLAQKPLCNDTGKFHCDDIVEDIVQTTIGDLQALLPMSHFDAIVMVHCGAVLSTQSFLNLEALLKPEGYFVAAPANMQRNVQIPCTLELQAVFDGDGSTYQQLALEHDESFLLFGVQLGNRHRAWKKRAEVAHPCTSNKEDHSAIHSASKRQRVS